MGFMFEDKDAVTILNHLKPTGDFPLLDDPTYGGQNYHSPDIGVATCSVSKLSDSFRSTVVPDYQDGDVLTVVWNEEWGVNAYVDRSGRSIWSMAVDNPQFEDQWDFLDRANFNMRCEEIKEDPNLLKDVQAAYKNLPQSDDLFSLQKRYSNFVENKHMQDGTMTKQEYIDDYLANRSFLCVNKVWGELAELDGGVKCRDTYDAKVREHQSAMKRLEDGFSKQFDGASLKDAVNEFQDQEVLFSYYDSMLSVKNGMILWKRGTDNSRVRTAKDEPENFCIRTMKDTPENRTKAYDNVFDYTVKKEHLDRMKRTFDGYIHCGMDVEINDNEIDVENVWE